MLTHIGEIRYCSYKLLEIFETPNQFLTKMLGYSENGSRQVNTFADHLPSFVKFLVPKNVCYIAITSWWNIVLNKTGYTENAGPIVNYEKDFLNYFVFLTLNKKVPLLHDFKRGWHKLFFRLFMYHTNLFYTIYGSRICVYCWMDLYMWKQSNTLFGPLE